MYDILNKLILTNCDLVAADQSDELDCRFYRSILVFGVSIKVNDFIYLTVDVVT